MWVCQNPQGTRRWNTIISSNFISKKSPYLQISWILWPIAKATYKYWYTIKDSFSFRKDVSEINASFFMTSFDIKSLFTNIPLTETLNLCLKNFYRNQARVGNLTKSSLYSLLKITIFKSFFIFDGKFYEKCDGRPIGSPLGPTLVTVFMCHFENIWLETVLLISNQLFTGDSLTIHFYSFEQRIMLKSLEIISTNNIKTINLHRKLWKMIHCHLWI